MTTRFVPTDQLEDTSLSEIFESEPDRTAGLITRPVRTETRQVAIEIDGYVRYQTISILTNRP